MLVARERLERLDSATVGDFLLLSYDRRLHTRQRACLEGGEHIALMLPRGTVLRDGDVLRCEGGRLVQVRAAEECISRIASSNPLQLARAAYHLGNRHVPVQVGPGWLAYQHDHVLDGMIAEMGLAVTSLQMPFEPEAGGYRHGEGAPSGDRHAGHSHDHDHDHGHSHAGGHSHGQ